MTAKQLSPTLCKSCNHTSKAGKWYGTPIDEIRQYLGTGINDQSVYTTPIASLRSNIAYNIQYCQFLKKSIDDLDISQVSYTMLVKTYIITASSVIEAIIHYLVFKAGENNQTNFIEVGKGQILPVKTTEGKVINTGDGHLHTEIRYLLKKDKKTDVSMDFHTLQKKCEKHKLFGQMQSCIVQ